MFGSKQGETRPCRTSAAAEAFWNPVAKVSRRGSKRKGKARRDRRIARQGADDRRLPRRRLRRRVERGPHPRPPAACRRDPGEAQEGAVGAPRREHRERLRAALRRRRGQEEDRRAAEEACRGGGRGPARDGRGPRGRGDRLAPAGGPQAEGSGQPDGLPRDHTGRDQPRARRDAPHRRAPRGRAGDAPHPRPPLWLRGLARPLEEDHAGPFGRSRPVGRDAPRGRARARADGLRARGVVGHQGDLRAGSVRGAALVARRPPDRDGPRHRAGREAPRRGAAATRRGHRARPRRAAAGRPVPRPQRREQALLPATEPAVHDVHPAAGSEPQAPLHRPDDDAHRPAPLRERLHHLHADGLDDALRLRAQGSPGAGGRALWLGVRRRAAAPLRAQGEERAGGARGDQAGRRHLSHAAAGRWRALAGRAGAVRADLDPHDRVADGGREGRDGLRQDRGHVVGGGGCRVRGGRAP